MRMDDCGFNRRDFLKTVGLAGFFLADASCSRNSSSKSEAQMTASRTKLRASLGQSIRYPNCSGDVWTTAWADDDNLYSVTDDTTGFNKGCNSNLAINRIIGGPPPNVTGETVNGMNQFGKSAELLSDGASWKASGLTCVDGVLYLSVSRHAYADDKHGFSYHIQETWDASIVKSTDHGETWSATPQLDHAMFPGRIFSNPFFVQYGEDGKGPSKDGANEYVYAISNDGAWNNGNWMTMGRVRRDHIARLDPGDWEFFHGYDNKKEPMWGPRHDNALYVFRAPNQASMTGVHYIAGLDLYVMPQWYYNHLDDPKRAWNVTRWELYYSPHPWGPWTLFHTQDFEPQGFYNPSIPSKFISADGKNFWIFVAGGGTSWTTGKYYGLNMIPVTLDVKD